MAKLGQRSIDVVVIRLNDDDDDEKAPSKFAQQNEVTTTPIESNQISANRNSDTTLIGRSNKHISSVCLLECPVINSGIRCTGHVLSLSWFISNGVNNINSYYRWQRAHKTIFGITCTLDLRWSHTANYWKKCAISNGVWIKTKIIQNQWIQQIG